MNFPRGDFYKVMYCSFLTGRRRVLGLFCFICFMLFFNELIAGRLVLSRNICFKKILINCFINNKYFIKL